MNWTPGIARCRDTRLTAQIIGEHAGFLIGVVYPTNEPLSWRTVSWAKDGISNVSSGSDLMPPTITREALAEEILRMLGLSRSYFAKIQAIRVVAHVIDAVKAGRVE